MQVEDWRKLVLWSCGTCCLGFWAPNLATPDCLYSCFAQRCMSDRPGRGCGSSLLLLTCTNKPSTIEPGATTLLSSSHFRQLCGRSSNFHWTICLLPLPNFVLKVFKLEEMLILGRVHYHCIYTNLIGVDCVTLNETLLSSTSVCQVLNLMLG